MKTLDVRVLNILVNHDVRTKSDLFEFITSRRVFGARLCGYYSYSKMCEFIRLKPVSADDFAKLKHEAGRAKGNGVYEEWCRNPKSIGYKLWKVGKVKEHRVAQKNRQCQ